MIDHRKSYLALSKTVNGPLPFQLLTANQILIAEVKCQALIFNNSIWNTKRIKIITQETAARLYNYYTVHSIYNT